MTPPGPRRAAPLPWVCRLLLYLFPAEFRARFGDEIAADAGTRLAAARARGALAYARQLTRSITDIAVHAMHERRARPVQGGAMGLEDVRLAVRGLRRQPSLVMLVVATLGVGIGATTAVFSVANTLVLQTLPYDQPHRLVSLAESNVNRTGGRLRLIGGHMVSGTFNVSLPNLYDWQAAAPALEAVGAWSMADVNVAGPQGAERVAGARMTPGLFAVLGTSILRGRGFEEADRAPGLRRVILSESAWRQFFNRDADVIGKSVIADGEAHEVVGIVGDIDGFEARVWRPVPDAAPANVRRNHAFRTFGRLREGATIEQLQQQLDIVASRLADAYPETNKGWVALAQPLQASLTEDVTSAIGLLTGAVAALLLLAMANTANLLGARATALRRDFAVRAALGASRLRLLRQVLTESLLLAVAGAGLGGVVAYGGVSVVTAVISADVSLWQTPAVDGRALAFSLGLAVCVALACGLWPAWSAARQDPHGALQERSSSSPATARRTRAVLAVVQVATASVLMVGTLLLLGSLRTALGADPGFEPAGALSFRVAPPRAGYADAASLTAYYDSLLQRVRQIPGVEAAGAVSGIPLGSSNTVRGVIAAGTPKPETFDDHLALYQVATPGYLQALGARLRGREFAATDTATSEPVMVINQHLADRLFPGQDPVGRQAWVFTDEPMARRIVGVIATIRHMALDEDEYSQYFVPMTQSPQRAMSLVLRAPSGLDGARVREAARAVDPTLPLYEVRTLDQVLRQSLAERRALTTLVTAFGVVALLLSCLGVYGVVTHAAAERRLELVIRLALGAQRGAMAGLVLRQALLLTAIGLGVGLGASVLLTDVVAEFVYGLEAGDPRTRVAVAVLMLLVTAAACLAPARRAARVDPAEVLKA